MRTTAEFQGSVLNLRGVQVHSMEGSSMDQELDVFQKHVTERFLELASVESGELLSLSWVRKLLDSFLCCQEEFKAILHNHRGHVSKNPQSFGSRNNNASRDHHHNSLGHFRSLSWSVSRNWSAAKQLQAIGNNLSPPKANDLVATNGLALPIYTMSSILVQLPWAAPVAALHERILEESKKRERKNSCGLLREIQQIEKCARVINDLADSVQFPLSEEKGEEVRQIVQDVSRVCGALKDGLDPLERQVREVFRRIVRDRTEGLDTHGRG
uniref:Uncharacterized protein n=1 Tax=Cajanus cajan TaxID=3821 RepID=A0A151T2Z1_CAJCA|nr:hypothetical protein KK1_015904 [Cajanus cajan]